MGFKSLKCHYRLRLRVAVLSVITVAFMFILFQDALQDKFEVYNPLGYVQGSITCFLRDHCHGEKPIGLVVEDKILVIPTVESADMSWVTEELPDWQRAIYIVNPSSANLTADSLVTPMNKGHEAMAYLTYIIDNYNGEIPSIVAFLHAHRQGFFEAWHVDTPLHDNVVAMRLLNLDTVRTDGYVNLRCNWNPGCNKRDTERVNGHVTSEIWDQLMNETSTPVFNGMPGGPGAVDLTSSFHDPRGDKDTGMTIFTTCCAQFAVSREQIYKRPLQDYVKMREWLVATRLDDPHSGRVLEYLWHIIFGMEATHCPDERTCYCKVYGRC